jgi:Domain of unknown function in PX-proteins (DUF3818)
VIDSSPVSQQEPSRTVKIFIELVQRHEQAFYNFVHKVHSKGAGLFDDLMRWIELFLTVVREGLGERVSLEFLLPHTGQDRVDILREVDAVALYHYRLKVAYENKVRKRFIRGASVNGSTTADEDDEATQALVDGVVRDLSFGDLVRGDAEDLAAEESESEDESESESESGTETDEDTVETETSHVLKMPLPSPSSSRTPATAGLREPTSSSFDLPSSPRTPVPRPRSLSLRSQVSAQLPKTGQSEIPPVPPLPSALRGQAVPTTSHPPQPPLRRRKTTTDVKRAFTKHAVAQPHKTPKKKPADIKPPELKVLPGLLPLFVEMVSVNMSLCSLTAADGSR